MLRVNPGQVLTGLLTAEAEKGVHAKQLTVDQAVHAEQQGVSAALDEYGPKYQEGGVVGHFETTFTPEQQKIYDAAYGLARPSVKDGVRRLYAAARPEAEQLPNTATDLARVFSDVAQFCHNAQANQALGAVAEGTATPAERAYLANVLLNEVSRSRQFGDGIMVLGPNDYDQSRGGHGNGPVSSEANFARAMLVAMRLRDALDVELRPSGVE